MAVHQPRHQHPALAVEPEIGTRGALHAALEDLCNPAIVADQQSIEALNPAFGIQRKPVDIVDKGIGICGDGGDEQDCADNCPHLPPRRGSRRISALVSWRPPPMAWTST